MRTRGKVLNNKLRIKINSYYSQGEPNPAPRVFEFDVEAQHQEGILFLNFSCAKRYTCGEEAITCSSLLLVPFTRGFRDGLLALCATVFRMFGNKRSGLERRWLNRSGDVVSITFLIKKKQKKITAIQARLFALELDAIYSTEYNLHRSQAMLLSFRWNLQQNTPETQPVFFVFNFFSLSEHIFCGDVKRNSGSGEMKLEMRRNLSFFFLLLLLFDGVWVGKKERLGDKLTLVAVQALARPK